MSQGSKKKRDSRGKGGRGALIACLVVIIALLAVVIVLLLKNNGNKADDTPKRKVVVNEQNAEEIASKMIDKPVTPVGSYEVKMNATWYFEDGKSASDNAYVENPVSNTNPVYFDVVRSDTGETIFASPILPVSTHIDAITLDTELPAGEYDCVCTYYLLDEDDNPVSKVNVGLIIIVKN